MNVWIRKMQRLTTGFELRVGFDYDVEMFFVDHVAAGARKCVDYHVTQSSALAEYNRTLSLSFMRGEVA